MGDEYRAEVFLHELRVVVHVLIGDLRGDRVDRLDQLAVREQQARAFERRVAKGFHDFRGPGREHTDGHGLVRVDTCAESARDKYACDIFEPDPHGAYEHQEQGEHGRLGLHEVLELALPDIKRVAAAADDGVSGLAFDNRHIVSGGVQHAALVYGPGVVKLKEQAHHARAADALGRVLVEGLAGDRPAFDLDVVDDTLARPLPDPRNALFERRTGGPGADQHPVFVPDHDLGIGAHVDQDRYPV